MDEQPVLFTKIILIKDVIDPSSLKGKHVRLEIDQAYKIGDRKSIAVINEDIVIGHLSSKATRTVWRHLRAKTEMLVDVYEGIAGGWENKPWFCMETGTFEIGIRLQLLLQSREEGKLFMGYVTHHKLNSFSGVTMSNCPESLKCLAFPVKDENHVSTLIHADIII
jgi:hypothetical protein